MTRNLSYFSYSACILLNSSIQGVTSLRSGEGHEKKRNLISLTTFGRSSKQNGLRVLHVESQFIYACSSDANWHFFINSIFFNTSNCTQRGTIYLSNVGTVGSLSWKDAVERSWQKKKKKKVSFAEWSAGADGRTHTVHTHTSQCCLPSVKDEMIGPRFGELQTQKDNKRLNGFSNKHAPANTHSDRHTHTHNVAQQKCFLLHPCLCSKHLYPCGASLQHCTLN